MLKIFLVQYLTILLLGVQSLNVRDGRYLCAAITSLFLGIAGWFVTGVVATAYKTNDIGVFLCFITAGPCGIMSSMLLYEKCLGKQ